MSTVIIIMSFYGLYCILMENYILGLGIMSLGVIGEKYIDRQ